MRSAIADQGELPLLTLTRARDRLDYLASCLLGEWPVEAAHNLEMHDGRITDMLLLTIANSVSGSEGLANSIPEGDLASRVGAVLFSLGEALDVPSRLFIERSYGATIVVPLRDRVQPRNELLAAVQKAAQLAAVLPALVAEVDALLALGSLARPAITHLGGNSYSVPGSEPICVSDEHDWLIQAFLGTPIAMEEADLEKASGVTNVSRAIKLLRSNYQGVFAPFVRPAIKRGNGGYFINVISAPPAKEARKEQRSERRVG